MDTHTFSRDGGDTGLFPIAYEDEDPVSLELFRDLLHRALSIDDDTRFWNYLEQGIAAIERGMTPESIARFEYAADYVLVFHGMPSWTSMKHRNGPAAAAPSRPPAVAPALSFGTA